MADQRDQYNGSGSGRYFDSTAPSERRGRGGLGFRGRGGRHGNRNSRGGNDVEWWNRSQRRVNNPRPRLPVGSRSRNRFAKQYDETGVARKTVRGGRIAKVRKVRDPEPDLYCKACEYYLADANAKAAHDRGRIHLQKIEELRENLNKEAAENAEFEPNFDKRSERPCYLHEVNDTLEKTDAEMFKLYKKALNDKRKPAMYSKWCERSLRGIPKAPHRAYEESVRRVQREIMHVTAQLYDDGTWLLQNWDSKKLASGKWYTETKPQGPYKELVIPDWQVREAEESAPALRDIPVENPSGVSVESIAPIAEQDQMATHMEVDTTNDRPNGNEGAGNPIVVKKPPLMTVNVIWRVPECADDMVRANTAKYSDEIVSQFAIRFPRDCVPKFEKEEGDILQESLIQEFKTLKNQFANEEYDCSIQFGEDVNALIEKMEKSGRYRRQIQVCIDMLVKSAISSFHFGLLIRPLARLMESFDEGYVLEDMHKEYVGYWVLSLLMVAGQTLSKAPNISLDCKLREIPTKFLKFEAVKLGLAALRALVSNNYGSFFNLYSNSLVHMATKKRSFYIMQSFVHIVRQQALLTFGAPGPTRGNLVYQHPSAIPLTRVLADLKWTADESEEAMWNVEEAKKQMKALGLRVMTGGDGGAEHLECNKHSAHIIPVKPHYRIDGATIFGFMNRKNLLRLK